MAKNTAVFGIYQNRGMVESAVDTRTTRASRGVQSVVGECETPFISLSDILGVGKLNSPDQGRAGNGQGSDSVAEGRSFRVGCNRRANQLPVQV